MKNRKILCAALALLLTFSLCACTAAPTAGAVPTASAAPVATAAPTPDAPSDGRVHVATVDELLAAIAPGASIYLEDGVYDLSTAEGYGGKGGEYYRWDDISEGYELVIDGVTDMSVTAALSDKKLPVTSIVTVPRTANVLRFENCGDISFFGVVLGHTEEPGVCSGGVLAMMNVDDASFEYCELFGCGTLALDAISCEDVTIQNSVIRHCTFGAVSADRCRDIEIKLCEVYDCGDWRLFSFESSSDCAVLNCDIHDNDVSVLLRAGYSTDINMLGCSVRDNTVNTAAFNIDAYGDAAVVAGCEFANNTQSAWFGSEYEDEEFRAVVGLDGTELDAAALESMKCEHIEWTPPTVAPVTVSAEPVHVSTVDEFLAAIVPGASIYLEEGVYELSAASNYGAYGGRCYSWTPVYEGAELLISDVDKLTITGAGADKVTIATSPRYANVLAFDDCDELTVSGVTVGHTEEPGACSGGVIYLSSCDDALIDGCALFGCGTVGVDAYNCESLRVNACDIYDCSSCGVWLSDCEEVSVTGCNIHDIADIAIIADGCDDVAVNDTVIERCAGVPVQLCRCEDVAFTNSVTPELLGVFECKNVTIDGKTV